MTNSGRLDQTFLGIVHKLTRWMCCYTGLMSSLLLQWVKTNKTFKESAFMLARI